MGKLPQLNVEVRRTRCLSSSRVLILYPSVELAERAYEAEPLRLPPEALGRRTRLPSGNGKRLFKGGRLQGFWALRLYENCAGQLVQRSPITREEPILARYLRPRYAEPRENKLSRLQRWILVTIYLV